MEKNGKGKNIESVVFVAILVFLVFSTPPFAMASPDEVIYVSDNYATIQEAVNAATDGDTIIVRNGTYYENVVLNKKLTLIGEGLPTINPQGYRDAIKITSNNCVVRGFRCTISGWYFGIRAESDGNLIENNTCENGYMGGIGLWSSSNNVVTNNTCENNGVGIYSYHSSNNMIRSNKICESSSAGIYLTESSSNNYIMNNEISNNNQNGIELHNCLNNTISNNKIRVHYYGGIRLCGSSNNVITNNTCENHYQDGIGLFNSQNNTIFNNTLYENGRGIRFVYNLSNDNIVCNNIIYNNYYGTFFDSSGNNFLYLNNFINNSDNIYSYDSTNIWNSTEEITYTYDGTTYENYTGNYWDDYTGNDADGDGIGDTPYSRDSESDVYPLMEPFENYMITLTEPYTKTDVGVTTNITLASPEDIAAYLPPEYADMDMSDAIVLNVNITDNTPGNLTDDAYTDITIKIDELDIETCKVFKTGIGFLPEVDDVTTRPTVSGDPAFSRDLVNKTVTVRLYVGDPLLGVIPPATPSVFDTGPGTYPSIMGTHKGEIKPSCNITVSKLYTYPCPGTGGHTESIELYENGKLIANGTWEGYAGDWHNITLHNVTGDAPYVRLLKGHKYNYTIVTGSYPQIIHAPSKEVIGGTITCDKFIDANGKIYTDWIPAIKLCS